jgi:hypothetical protein
MNEVISIDISDSQLTVAIVKIIADDNQHLTDAELINACTLEISDKNIFRNILKKSEAISLDTENSENSDNFELIAFESLTKLLKQALSKFSNIPDTCLLTIPPIDTISFNIDLPFTDAKNIRQVIDMEVQDSLPFEIDDFLIQHTEVKRNAGTNNDIFVSIIPKKLIDFFIKSLKECNLEPYLITTRSSTISGLYIFDPQLKNAETLACLSLDSDNLALNLKVKGTIVSCKDFCLSNYSPATELNEVRLKLSSFEKKYDVTFDKIILFANQKHKHSVQQQLGRSVEVFDIKSYINHNNNAAQKIDFESSSLQHALVATAYTPDLNREKPLTNFRTREYSFNPLIKYLLENWKRIIPQVSLTSFIAFLLIASIFLSREYKIIRLYKSIHSQVQDSKIEANLQKGAEITELEKVNANLEQQLTSLGSPSALSALDILLDLSYDIKDTKKRAAGLEVQEINIGPSGIIVSGTARDYSDVEKFEKELKKRRNVYCKIKRDTSSSSSQARGFKFILSLCES